MSTPNSQALYDGAAWGCNILSSVCIIFINKLLMSTRNGYAFTFATTLCALHYLSCSLSIWATQRVTGGRKVKLPWKDLAIFIVTANASIASLNLSLLINSVGFYQIAKLLIIPFVCLVEHFWLGHVFTRLSITSVVILIAGVAVVTVTDVTMQRNLLGLIVAAISVVSSGMQQILCRTLQKQHALSANELLSNTAPGQAFTLLLIGPFLDHYVTGHWVNRYLWTVPAVSTLVLSCFCAIFVNLSQFACLGRFSAVSYQVLGHSKTVCVLLGGWAFLGDVISAKQLLGMVLAVAGMVLYGYSTLPGRAAPAGSSLNTKARQSSDVESQALLKTEAATPAVQIQVTAGEGSEGSAKQQNLV